MVDKKGFDIVRSGCGGVVCLSFQPSMFYSVSMQSYELNCCSQNKIATNVMTVSESLDFFLFSVAKVCYFQDSLRYVRNNERCKRKKRRF